MTRRTRNYSVAACLLSVLALLAAEPLPAIPLGGEWLTDLEQARYLARKQQRELVVVLTAAEHPLCKMLAGETLADDEVRRLLDKTIKVKVDVELRGELLGRFGARGLPLVVFYDQQGRELDRVTGFRDPAQFAAEFDRAHREEKNFPGLVKRAAQNRADRELQKELLDQRFKRNHVDEGLALIKELIAASAENEAPWRAELFRRRALLLMRAERYQEALDALDAYYDSYPMHEKIEDYFFQKTDCYYRLDDYENARKTLEEYLEAYPMSPRGKEARDLLEYSF